MLLKKKLSYSESKILIESNRVKVKKWYLVENLTAGVIAERLNVEYSNNFQKALSRVFAGAKGHGGAREGSGNKKGIEFCPTCKKAKENCSCKKE